MSTSLVPSSTSAAPATAQPAPIAARLSAPLMDGDQGGMPMQRYLSAVLRYKWIVLLVVLVGTALGVWYTTLQVPRYSVTAALWIGAASTEGPGGGSPAATNDPGMSASAWQELLSSRELIENVIRRRQLYLTVPPKDSALFGGFVATENLNPGRYSLEVDSAGLRYSLLDAKKTVLESGAVGDSVGRSRGFAWRPSAQELGAGRKVEFRVTKPDRLASLAAKELNIWHPDIKSSVLRLSLRWTEPDAAARVLNTLLKEYVTISADLERRNVKEVGNALRERVDLAERELTAAERALQNFQVGTITLPTHATPIAGGVQMTQTPVISDFFARKIQYDNLRRDRLALERVLSQAGSGGAITANALYSIPTVSGGGAPDLQAALAELTNAEAQLRAAEQVYTADYKLVRDLRQNIQTMKSQTIPALARATISNLRQQETDLTNQLGTASQELRAIPARTIEEMRLQRNVSDRGSQYQMLKTRYEQVRMAEASAIPDVSILDTAVVPSRPDSDPTVRILLMAIAASVGAAILLAILLDATDKRFRYPEQVTHEMGLPILGALPHITRTNHGITDPEEASQLVESFRTVRLNLVHLFGPAQAITLTISSPGVGDGKSLVAANLALSFAEGGYRTLLVDGDIRRGQLHSVFGASRTPGLLDLLVGEVPLERVLLGTSHDRLALLPSGTRHLRGPEILLSNALPKLLADLKTRYDVILIDSPPLGAGTDPFVFSTVTGSLMLVVRTGETDRKMAQAKLQLVDRLPVRMLGAVLNGVRTHGVYKYYSYIGGYGTSDELQPSGSGRQVLTPN
ncbi:MAG: GumC family protein [Gemmatimonadaceae bacterium]